MKIRQRRGDEKFVLVGRMRRSDGGGGGGVSEGWEDRAVQEGEEESEGEEE